MKASKSVDFARAADDCAKHGGEYPRELFERLRRLDVGVHQQRILDLGTGTGTLARGFAQQGCEVTGIDRSEELLAVARTLDEQAGVQVDYQVAKAERTGLATHHFEVCCAGQSFHWFKRGKVAREARRLLVPGGRMCIVHFDWLPLPGNVAEATEQLILGYNHRWALAGSTGLYPPWLTDLRAAGFGEVETFSFDVDVPFSHKAWRGRVRASSGVGPSMSRGKVVRFDEKLRLLLLARFPKEPLFVPHRLWAIVCRSPAG